MKNKNDIVALNDSQILRWICELNGVNNLDEQVNQIKREIRRLKKQPKTIENKKAISELYARQYSLMYQKDYICVIMNSKKDYERANEGFTINGYKYHRLLGTNGGIKKSTIVYVGDKVYQEILQRISNGRDKNKPVIPAKLEAYQALVCSGSIPVTTPRILVVNDCNVSFKERVIKISDSDDTVEPIVETVDGYEIEYCDSDGYGLMSPSYSRIVNRDLYGDQYSEETISGINIRYAWTKGMLFTFDFLEFARQINNEIYMVADAWGDIRDVRDYDVILTTSMVKLWDSYTSLEHYISCCNENHYQFSVSKTTPHQLENVRNMNYQFLQTYKLSDEELIELCQPTIDEIKDVLGGDWRKSVVFLKGMFLDGRNVDYVEDDFIKAIMIDERMMDDPFIIRKIHSMIRKRIEMAAKGSIKINGNFAIVSGDPYSLAQSIFGLPITGLLKKGEIYHKHWMDKRVEDIAVFRAPMTCHNNIRRMRVVKNEIEYSWYQYITTGIVLNSWDSTCDALNGADKDGDILFSTDNKIIVENTLNSLTIECVQRKAEKIIPTEKDMVTANIAAFGDEIGSTTNRITTMIERQAEFAEGSNEYKELSKRIMCGQHYQQCCIDKAKGIVSEPMPDYWYSKSACNKLSDDTDEERAFKRLCLNIVAEDKPYFMKYVYPDLMAKYNKYIKDTNSKCIREFKINIHDLEKKVEKTTAEKKFLDYYHKLMPVGDNDCTVNRLCYLFEDTFKDFLKSHAKSTDFDYTILKSGTEYSKNDYNKIKKIYAGYEEEIKEYQQLAKSKRLDKDEVSVNRAVMLMEFRSECEKICPTEKELCDIVIDLCYSTHKSKQFAWDICGDIIIDNLLEKNDYIVNYPLKVDSSGQFEFGGEQFIMCSKQYKECDEIL